MFSVAKGSYRVISQGEISSREWRANFAIRVDSKDRFQKRFQRPESSHRLFYISTDDRTPRRCIFAILFWNQYTVSVADQRNDISTYPSIPSLVYLPVLHGQLFPLTSEGTEVQMKIGRGGRVW